MKTLTEVPTIHFNSGYESVMMEPGSMLNPHGEEVTTLTISQGDTAARLTFPRDRMATDFLRLLVCDPDHSSPNLLAAACAEANEYCQQHGIGKWGESATAALIADHKRLAALQPVGLFVNPFGTSSNWEQVDDSCIGEPDVIPLYARADSPPHARAAAAYPPYDQCTALKHVPVTYSGDTAQAQPAPATPEITCQMKAQFIGEFSWEEEAPYYDEDGELHEDHVAKHTVPWSLCKRIYQEMAAFAAGRSALPAHVTNSEKRLAAAVMTPAEAAAAFIQQETSQ